MQTVLGLTAEQKAFRKNVIGGSDANIIMGGDSLAVMKLWREKRGEIAPENLDHILPVRMGQWTEPLNRAWFTERTGRVVSHDGEERISLDFPWMAATLDGLTDGEQTLFEAKHVGAFWKPDEVVAKYQPQCQHNMVVCDLSRAVLSVFFGNHKWEHWEIERDDAYCDAMMAAEQQFWRCVNDGTMPADMPIISTPAEKAAARFELVDMTGSEDWKEWADSWLELAPQKKLIAAAESGLKSLVDVDVKEARGHGVVVTVDRANRFSIKEESKPLCRKKK